MYIYAEWIFVCPVSFSRLKTRASEDWKKEVRTHMDTRVCMCMYVYYICCAGPINLTAMRERRGPLLTFIFSYGLFGRAGYFRERCRRTFCVAWFSRVKLQRCKVCLLWRKRRRFFMLVFDEFFGFIGVLYDAVKISIILFALLNKLLWYVH